MKVWDFLFKITKNFNKKSVILKWSPSEYESLSSHSVCTPKKLALSIKTHGKSTITKMQNEILN
jgi:hypothetical protein